MAKYQAYAEYKDSGIEWLGEIPSHWEKILFKRVVLQVKDGTHGTHQRVEEGSYLLSAKNVFNHGIEIGLTESRIPNKDYQEIVSNGFPKKGDILVTCVGTIGRSCVYTFEKPIAFQRSVAFLRLNSQCDSKYYKYFIESKQYQSQLQSLIKSSAQGGVYMGDLINTVVANCDFLEQKQISNFLDHETSKIDHLIEKQQQLIELLKEKCQAVISYLVNVKEGEASIKLKYAVEILAGYSFSSTGFKTDSNDGVALLRGINVGVGNIKWDECVWWSKSDTEGLERYILKKGDLVFGMDRPWISTGARVAEIQEYDLPSYLVQRVARVRALRGFYQPYIKLILGSKEFKSFIESDLTGVSVPHISTDQIISFPIRKLYFEQQVKQTDQAIESINKIDFLIVKAESAIQLMQERRTALISAVVTGKIDVRNWQAPTIAEAQTEFSA